MLHSRRVARLVVLLSLALPTALLAACQIGIPSAPVPEYPPTRSFLYQLQEIDLEAIAQSCYDLAIIDYSSDGSEQGEFTRNQIATLTDGPAAPKHILAYLSVGEAEAYRFYWKHWWSPGSPSWLDRENPHWEENYKVHYWDPEWQQIVFEYVDRVIDAGFDGVYLDLIDSYEYYETLGRTTAAAEMVEFVGAIRAHVTARTPGYLIIVQNAAELVDLDSAYIHLVDGIGQEDIYYGYLGDDIMTPPEATADLESHLDTFLAAGKLVLTVDYAMTPAHIDQAYGNSRAKGYVPFVTARSLNRMTVNPGHDPCDEFH